MTPSDLINKAEAAIIVAEGRRFGGFAFSALAAGYALVAIAKILNTRLPTDLSVDGRMKVSGL